MALSDTLKQKAGPLPVWAWGAGAVVVGAGFIIWRRRGKKGAAAAAPTAATDYQQFDTGVGGGGSAGGGGSGSSGGGSQQPYYAPLYSQQQQQDPFLQPVPAGSAQTQTQQMNQETGPGAPASNTNLTAAYDTPIQLPQYAGTNVGYVTPRFQEFFSQQPTVVQDYLRSIAAK